MILSPSPSAASLGEGHTAGLFVPGAQPASSSPTRIHQLLALNSCKLDPPKGSKMIPDLSV